MTADRSRYGWTILVFGMQDVCHQRARDVVGAVAVVEVGHGPDRMLGDADVITQAAEMASNRRHAWAAMTAGDPAPG